MNKLKLSELADDKPVKVTHELSGAVHRDLVAYAAMLSGDGKPAIDPVRLIDPMLSRFMATDRAFRKATKASSRTRREPATPSSHQS
ncbi:DUF2274 domain-containing protein [Pseudorhodoplanes sp.]|uniref:DUF2274 domain-containing protein n=1 Tax=Pseudorhodoplanes sp. TaxID=1934341 RepID=UPI002C0AE6BC|nr:DUF2274 domain-containing protein [Pseudorhodoplanes sp.]HWV51671.1 DUF2274 domain-containing protein [Pseudorhodoplanes sp.]